MTNYTEYKKPYPVIGDLIKNKNYDYVTYRISLKDQDIFAGCFKAEKCVKNGLTVVVEGAGCRWIFTR